ncbi:Odontogenic ameloblast-associated protein [Sciurus carolinensis]|uniref:Odontogenic ameloblast-associated protein n=1 Tax=Sciurus carolinensis TaxID=30640 RepID=A0AA41MCI7_SCICA|nr:Odontogenic ameloblast-associated protein [Sciurus carolinensis]
MKFFIFTCLLAVALAKHKKEQSEEENVYLKQLNKIKQFYQQAYFPQYHQAYRQQQRVLNPWNNFKKNANRAVSILIKINQLHQMAFPQFFQIAHPQRIAVNSWNHIKEVAYPYIPIVGPFNSWIPPFSGLLQQQQQARVPGHPQFSLSTLDQFAGLSPSQIPFPRQVGFAQGSQAGQLGPSQPQAPSQTQQGPNHVMPYVFSFKMPQEQAQMLQYYPVYMLLPWEQSQQTVTQSPQQTGQQQFEEQGVPGGQQQLTFDTLLGTAPETVVMPGGEVIPYLQKEVIKFSHDSAGVLMPSTSPKPSTTKAFASAVDPTIAPVLPEEKVE